MDAKQIGAFIAETRKENNMTQAELAQRLNVTDKAVSRWETGKGFPDIATLEPLSKALGVELMELMSARRLPEPVPVPETEKPLSDTLSRAGGQIRRARRRAFLSALLLALPVVVLVLVFLNSPAALPAAKGFAGIESLSDERLLLRLGPDAAGYELSPSPEDGTFFLTCWNTRWHRLFGQKQETLVLMEGENAQRLFYYPGSDRDGGDKLLWGEPLPDGGVVSLPRLVYNYWLVIALVLTVLLAAAAVALRRRDRRKILFHAAVLFGCLTAAILLVAAGRTVYSAPYYLSGILLVTAVLYPAVLWVLRRLRRKKPAAAA